jgi:para-nitrobenzyl esterase
MKLKRHLLTAALTLFCLSAANAQLLRTTVEQGEIEGVEHEGFALYKGIPYAEAPVGNLRWKAPVSKKPWKGVFKADKWWRAGYERGLPIPQCGNTSQE